MIELTLAEVADAVGGVLHGCEGTELVTGGAVPGDHQVSNALAAAAVALELGATPVAIATAPGDVVLIKAFRSAGLERIADGLLGAPGSTGTGSTGTGGGSGR